jgi:hypothetical protein
LRTFWTTQLELCFLEPNSAPLRRRSRVVQLVSDAGAEATQRC